MGEGSEVDGGRGGRGGRNRGRRDGRGRSTLAAATAAAVLAPTTAISDSNTRSKININSNRNSSEISGSNTRNINSSGNSPHSTIVGGTGRADVFPLRPTRSLFGRVSGGGSIIRSGCFNPRVFRTVHAKGSIILHQQEENLTDPPQTGMNHIRLPEIV